MATRHPSLDAARLDALTVRDSRRLRRRLDGARRIRRPEAREAVLTEITAEVEAAEERLAARRAALPAVSYPEALPVSGKKDDIAAAIRDHQVVIVAGETGSGKTTQLPKICLELGLGVRGRIGHTQPRRIAARTVAERIAEELDVELGGAVGYKVRFTGDVSDRTAIKVMTDGILLAELQTDRDLNQYDTLIIDEAHERSLNIDFILGYLKRLLPRRPDLKVVITSATIDPERFAAHFAAPDGTPAPIVEVSGRTYPVEVRYRPVVDPEDENADPDRDQVQAITDAVDELTAEGPGDILVFLSGEREIRDAADALAKRNARLRQDQQAEILPLYARLSSAEQHRVFQTHRGRRIVLATNVAETSLTVPGIKYVIDPGTARISRYSHRLKVQRLPIEPVSQASANQRKGRCGRTSDGICVRLYSEDDFDSRPEFTDPEILRTNLASVILQMTSIGLGDIAAFPFLEPPDRRQITDGVNLLHELGALDPTVKDKNRNITALGRKLAQMPVDPRLGRMVLEADRNGCLREVMVLAAALSIQDPRERPVDKQTQASQAHARFKDETSDFLGYLNLWNYLKEKQKELSGNQFRKLCRTEFINYLRIREWQDIDGQLRQTVKQMGLHPGTTEGTPDNIHRSLLSGLLSHVGLYDNDKREYDGARGARFAVFPGSGLFKKSPRFVMAAELVETSRLWARTAARIEPQWAEDLAQHLVKRTYSEPHWEMKQAAVVALERVTLYGVPLVAGRKVAYGRIDPELSRDLFIRHALVEGDWQTHHRFFHENRRLLEEVEDLEHRARRRDILVDDDTLFDFYDQRVPEDVVSGRHFDQWWKKASKEQPDLLSFEKSMLINERAGDVSRADYPDIWRQGDLRLKLTYQFEPGTEADGVTVHIPLAILNQVEEEGFDWQVPGLREELVTALIRVLPKPIRRHFVPAPNAAQAVAKVLARYQSAAAPDTAPAEPLLTVLSRELRRLGGLEVPEDAFEAERIPQHLRITFRVVGEKEKKLAEDTSLEALKRQLKPKMRETISKAAAPDGIERAGLTSFEGLGALPETFERKRGRHSVRAFPALVDEGGTAAVRMFDTEEEQRDAMWAGTRRLLLLSVPSPAKQVQKELSNTEKLALSGGPHGSVGALLEDCVAAAVDFLMAANGGPVREEAAFAALRDKVRAELFDVTLETVRRTARVLAEWNGAERRLKQVKSVTLLPALTDVREQLDRLVHKGFVTETGVRRLPDLVRYLRAVQRRLEALPEAPRRDAERMASARRMWDEYRAEAERLPAGRREPEELLKVRWMIEELRVSYFAQSLGTAHPVSEKRVLKALDAAVSAMA
ncbi:ATP-dependent RNA helicase HrpA [Mangrovactinospora gilvigrisea]|uniref:RNA helicase n=1 Tax=Mangrovactinospora gilvigrisea TaxID=1428644 RepID=A0A1J7CG70_9ACTN|nr:ATP-dependent RNA helicase HrpA [Mangrovactinospora gilvigrisea]OIV38658.1 ATP-dependent RNA helicase HrpA [Mangrovactinospora gilvigrisea]